MPVVAAAEEDLVAWDLVPRRQVPVGPPSETVRTKKNGPSALPRNGSSKWSIRGVTPSWAIRWWYHHSRVGQTVMASRGTSALQVNRPPMAVLVLLGWMVPALQLC